MKSQKLPLRNRSSSHNNSTQGSNIKNRFNESNLEIRQKKHKNLI